MKLLTPILVALSLAASCGPPVVLPECPPDTHPMVCHWIGTAECTSDGVDRVAGCYVQVDATTRLECVASCS